MSTKLTDSHTFFRLTIQIPEHFSVRFIGNKQEKLKVLEVE